MRNRAKCKLCGDIIESFAIGDVISCLCGEISIEGFDPHFKCYYRDVRNFLRVDDEGNEVVVREEGQLSEDSVQFKAPTKEEVLKLMEEMISKMDSLPMNAKTLPVTQSDLSSMLWLVLTAFRSS
jgi:hypothetical protein